MPVLIARTADALKNVQRNVVMPSSQVDALKTEYSNSE